MLRSESGVSYGFRFTLLGFVSTLAVVAISASPADARARHRHGASKAAHHRTAHAAHSYSPPYSAIVIDANSGLSLHEAAADSPRHPASLTKIMTLYLLFEQLDAGRMKLDTPLDVSAHAASMAPSKLGLKPGQTIAVEDAIRSLVTKSANDVAVVIAEALSGGDESQFAQQMTRKARALGMSRTTYRNASGLPNDEQITTARDQALLARAIQEKYPRYYRYFATPSFTYHGQSMRNHNHLLGRVEGLDGIKTGYTEASGFNLVTNVRRGAHHIVGVVLGGASARSRDARMHDLIEQTVMKSSTVHSVAMVTEAPEARTASAIAAALPAAPAKPEAPAEARPDPVQTSAIPPSAEGSADDIKPIAVKTVRVKAAAIRNGAIGTPSQATAPLPSQIVADRSPAPSLPTPADVLAQAKAILVASAKADPAKAEPAPQKAATAAPVAYAAVDMAPAQPSVHARSGWIIQVGALESITEAKARLATAQNKAGSILAKAEPFTEEVVKGDKTLYRARFAGLAKEQAEAACKSLKRSDIVCIAVKN